MCNLCSPYASECTEQQLKQIFETGLFAYLNSAFWLFLSAKMKLFVLGLYHQLDAYKKQYTECTSFIQV